MDNIYQPIYDAIRSRFSNSNPDNVIENYLHSLGVSRSVEVCTQMIQEVITNYDRPCVLFKPKVYLDGNMWCALYGDNLQDGIAGFGETCEKAMLDFDNNFRNQKLGVKNDHTKKP